MADSSTGGFLPPAGSPAPLFGDAFVDFIQEWVVGVTGLAGTFVIPRWQQEPPNFSNKSDNWCAIGPVNVRTPAFAAEVHKANSTSEIRRHEEIEFLASFYGPNAEEKMHLFRDGIQLAQNREFLAAQSVALVDSGDAVNVPELINKTWVNRWDLPFTLRRQLVRNFAILNILSAAGTIQNEETVTNFNA